MHFLTINASNCFTGRLIKIVGFSAIIRSYHLQIVFYLQDVPVRYTRIFSAIKYWHGTARSILEYVQIESDLQFAFSNSLLPLWRQIQLNAELQNIGNYFDLSLLPFQLWNAQTQIFCDKITFMNAVSIYIYILKYIY